MRALVTGASGFIGSTLIEELTRNGIEAFALMRSSSKPANLEGLTYHRVVGSLEDFDSLKRAVAGMDYVFHLAGVVAAPDRDAYFEANAAGTERLARAVAEANPGLKRFVYVSSLAAGGPVRESRPRVEGDPDQPTSIYGQSKLQGEIELLKFKDRFPITVIRPPMVYGPKDRGVFVVIKTVAKGWSPRIQGKTPTGDKFYSIIHSADLCRAVLLAATRTEIPSGEIFYATEEKIYTYRDLLSLMGAALSIKGKEFSLPPVFIVAAANVLSGVSKITGKSFPLNRDKLNEILPDYWICSNAKAKRELGFEAQLHLPEGMKQTVSWYKDKGWL